MKITKFLGICVVLLAGGLLSPGAEAKWRLLGQAGKFLSNKVDDYIRSGSSKIPKGEIDDPSQSRPLLYEQRNRASSGFDFGNRGGKAPHQTGPASEAGPQQDADFDKLHALGLGAHNTFRIIRLCTGEESKYPVEKCIAGNSEKRLSEHAQRESLMRLYRKRSMYKPGALKKR